ncbi:hypothetical protein P171DRAFT_37163 [Karstenula rhodostoma CBS 690.94]|uniref:Uncharacterized protein n=1 Tax=Karstenula rhodostoma CBS 690.94 TaxID=1392251 RepID=A0A9P4PG91_9PLEO|nr:hypothetical protein P171DRAFT_37163 [Karstenula rhodostoma CBS 690.94]
MVAVDDPKKQVALNGWTRQRRRRVAFSFLAYLIWVFWTYIIRCGGVRGRSCNHYQSIPRRDGGMVTQHVRRLDSGCLCMPSTPVHLGVRQMHWITLAMLRHYLHASLHWTRHNATLVMAI